MRKSLAVAAVWTAIALPLGISAYRAGALESRTFVWDPSSHALNGLRLADGITRVDPVGFMREIVYPHHYPPVHSVLQLPFFLVMGRTWDAARATSCAAIVAVAVLGILLARRCGADAIAGPAVLLAAIATSPHLLSTGAVPMLEIFGALGYVFFALVYARSLEAPDDPRRAAWAGAAAAIVYLTTANFGLILFLAIAANEALRGDVRAAARVTRAFFAGWRWLNPFNAAAALLFAVSGAIAATGGWKIGRLSMTNWLSPLSIGLMVFAAQWAWELWKRRAAMRAWPVRLRGFFWGTAVPVAVWFLLTPTRLRGTIDFMQGSGRSPDIDTVSWLLFYPRAWVGELHLSWAIGLMTVASMAAALWAWRRANDAMKFVTVLAAVATCAVLAHPMRDLRFMVGVLPLWWIVGARAVASGANRPVSIALAGILVAVAAVPGLRFHREALAPRIATWMSPPGTAETLAIIADEAAKGRSVDVYGAFAGLSHHAIEFEVRRRRSMRGLDLEFDPKKQTAGRVIVIEGAPEAHMEAGRGAAVAARARAMEESPAFRLVREERGDVRVRVWERAE